MEDKATMAINLSTKIIVIVLAVFPILSCAAAKTLSQDGPRPGDTGDSHSCDEISGVPSEIRSFLEDGGYYSKYTQAYGIPVLGSEKTGEAGLKRACYTLRYLLADHHMLRRHFYWGYGRVVVIGDGKGERFSDTPELNTQGDKSMDFNLGHSSHHVAFVRESTTACSEFQPAGSTDDVVMHEIAHVIYTLAAAAYDSSLVEKLAQIYNTSVVEKKKWERYYYATKDSGEMFAQGTLYYMGVSSEGIDREGLRAKDPELSAYFSKLYSCDNPYMQKCGGAPCKDSNSDCAQWSGNDGCTKYQSFMSSKCLASCSSFCFSTNGPRDQVSQSLKQNCGSGSVVDLEAKTCSYTTSAKSQLVNANGLLSTRYPANALACLSHCSRSLSCKSVNYDLEAGVCKLLTDSKTNNPHTSLEKSKTENYYEKSDNNCLGKPDIYFCQENPCLNGGSCAADSVLGFFCQCSAPYSGSTCQFYELPGVPGCLFREVPGAYVSGHNVKAGYKVSGVEQCLRDCVAEPKCKSIDWEFDVNKCFLGSADSSTKQLTTGSNSDTYYDFIDRSKCS